MVRDGQCLGTVKVREGRWLEVEGSQWLEMVRGWGQSEVREGRWLEMVGG